MRLTQDARSILGRSRIGMLALRTGRLPLVNPAAFHFAAGALWMTTSRYAVKTTLVRRDPRAAFFVDGGSRAILIQGTLEMVDPLALSGTVRAILDAPSFFMGLAGYTLKNAPFIAGYMLDLTRIPSEWMPYNRVVLRLEPTDIDVMGVRMFPEAQPARVPAVSSEVSRGLAGVTRGYACWVEGGRPLIVPSLWEVERGQVLVAPDGHSPRTGTAGALVVESHDHVRPSLMLGACIRGTFAGSGERAAVAERYGIGEAQVPQAVELKAERVTSWRGFKITTAVPRSSRRLRVVQA